MIIECKGNPKMKELTQKFIPRLDTIETSGLLKEKPNFIDFKARYHQGERMRTIKILRLLDEKLKNPRWKEVRDCRSLAYFARNKNSGEVKIIASSCKQRWCPTCAVAKAKFITAEITDWLKAVKKPKLLTVTLKHSTESLQAQIDKLYNAFRLLRRWKNFKKQIDGGIWFFQVHYASNGKGWHPHIHCLISGNYLQKEWISEAWKTITEDSYIVDIEQIKDVNKAAGYVARYCARPANLQDLTDSQAVELVKALHGRRLCGKFGIARVCQLTPSKPENSNDWSNIGSWYSVVVKPVHLPTAIKIIDAWTKNKVLAPNIDMRRYERNLRVQVGQELPDLSLDDLGIPIEGAFL
jgi:hypothetical protein